jgi:hypothetical protein
MARRHKKVIWTKQGYSTLDEALAYIAQDSLTAAQQLLESALDSAESLSLYLMGVEREDQTPVGALRRVPVLR